MEYKTVAEARNMDGLRVVLTAGVPGPWGEAAKAVLKVKNIPYVPVLQKAGAANEELLAWTGYRNAPTLMYANEPPRVTWLDILNLAERLQPMPSLVPADMEDRILMVGLINEIAGEGGMLWNSRQLMFRALRKALGEEATADNPMFRDYRYDAEAAASAVGKVIQVLKRLERQLERQATAGSRYMIADRLSALDLYWACFSQTLLPLPQDVSPIPDSLRTTWGSAAAEIAQAGYRAHERLFEHRDFIFRDHIGLPLDF
jgi:glutathione S-transferase